MKVKLIGIEGIAVLAKERVVLRVLADCDIGTFSVFHCRRGQTSGLPQGGLIDSVFWFPDRQVKADDLIILYSKEGKNSTKKIENDKTSHFYYWGEKRAIWGQNHIPVLVETKTFEYAQEDERTLEPETKNS